MKKLYGLIAAIALMFANFGFATSGDLPACCTKDCSEKCVKCCQAKTCKKDCCAKDCCNSACSDACKKCCSK